VAAPQLRRTGIRKAFWSYLRGADFWRRGIASDEVTQRGICGGLKTASGRVGFPRVARSALVLGINGALLAFEGL